MEFLVGFAAGVYVAIGTMTTLIYAFGMADDKEPIWKPVVIGSLWPLFLFRM